MEIPYCIERKIKSDIPLYTQSGRGEGVNLDKVNSLNKRVQSLSYLTEASLRSDIPPPFFSILCECN